jgi:hypothetical protein
VVYLKWKDTAPHGAVPMAFNIHKSFPRLIPSVLKVSEGMTFTSLNDGGGAYPGVKAGEQNKGFDSSIELLLSCSSAEEVKTKYFDHPAHLAAQKVIDPLVEDAWAMDWMEDRDTLVVPSANVTVMKHLVFFEFEEGTTEAQISELFAAWRTLPEKLPHVLAVSCGKPIRWDKGDKRNFHAGLVVDLEMTSADGVQEISDYANSDAYQKINAELLAPIRKSYVVMAFAEHGDNMGTGRTSKV